MLMVIWFLLAQPSLPSLAQRQAEQLRNNGSGERGRGEEEGNLGCTSRMNGKGQTHRDVGEQAGDSGM